VVWAAVALADAEGLEAVTIRAVARRLGTGVMSLYSYVPDKQTLVYDMVEEVSGEISLPGPGGDWRADMHLLAGEQRTLLSRHPWLIDATSHLQPLGPGTLAVLEFALGALEPTGLPAGARLEAFAMVNGFVMAIARTERAAAPDPAQAAAQVARLQELLATGQYPRFAAALAEGGPAAADPAAQFGQLLDRILDGLIGPADLPAPVLVPALVAVPVPVVVPVVVVVVAVVVAVVPVVVVVVVPAAAEQAADDEKHEDDGPQADHEGVAADDTAQDDGSQDHDGHHQRGVDPGGRGAGGRHGGLRGGPGRGRRLARQVSEQRGQVPRGAGLQRQVHPLFVLVGGEPAGLEMLAQLSEGPVAVGIGYPHPAGLRVLGGGAHVGPLQRRITTL
jgi:AcrR family transcriptional regulator